MLNISETVGKFQEKEQVSRSLVLVWQIPLHFGQVEALAEDDKEAALTCTKGIYVTLPPEMSHIDTLSQYRM